MRPLSPLSPKLSAIRGEINWKGPLDPKRDRPIPRLGTRRAERRVERRHSEERRGNLRDTSIACVPTGMRRRLAHRLCRWLGTGQKWTGERLPSPFFALSLTTVVPNHVVSLTTVAVVSKDRHVKTGPAPPFDS